MEKTTTILSINERLANIEGFLKKKNTEGPVIGFFLGDYFILKNLRHAENLLGNKDLRPSDIDIEGLLLDYEQEFEKNKNMPGSSIWGAEVIWSIPWFEAILGGRVEVSGTSYIAVAHPTETTKMSGDKGEIFIDTGWEDVLLKYIRRLVEFSNGRYPVVAPLIRGCSDILSIIFGYENTLFKIMDEPEAVKKILVNITDYYLKLRKKIFEVLPMFYGGSFIYGRNIWLPGKSFPLQQDAAGSIMSPDIYKKFLLPLDEMVIDEYPELFYHLHSGTYKVLLDSLLTLDKLKVIEIWLDQSGPSTEELISDFNRVLQSGKSLYVWSEAPIEQLEFLIKNLENKGRGVFIEIKVQNREEAKEKMEYLSKFI